MRKLLHHEYTPKILSLFIVPALLSVAVFNAHRIFRDNPIIVRTTITEVMPIAHDEDVDVQPVTTADALCTEPHAVDLARWVRKAAAKTHVPPALLLAVMYYESGFNPRARSPKGAFGLMQLMPSVAQQFHIGDRAQPELNIDGGAQLLARLLQAYHGDVRLALAAYNAGSGSVDLANGIPPFPETRQYIANILPEPKAQKPSWEAAESFYRIWNQ